VYLRAATLATRADQPQPAHYMARRGAQLQAMLDRAAARGETPPTIAELLEVVLAPLYFHALFLNRPADDDHARRLVDRLLTLAGARQVVSPADAG
jgi:hypothetical protein